MTQENNIITIPEKEQAFKVIKKAVDKTANMIKPTFGPASNKVIIAKATHGFVVDDGVQIARDLELQDPVEHAIMKVVRETAIRTNDRVGDGTTGAIIMLQAIIEEVSKLSRVDGRKIENELKKAMEEVKEQLDAKVVQIDTAEQLLKVARVSFDDEKIAKLIADAWFELGKDGVLTVDRSKTMDTFVEIAEGVKIDRGYISPYMITNAQRMESVIEKPYILFTDYRLTEASDVIGIMNKLAEKGITNLVIVAENVEGAALSTLVINKLNQKFNAVAINTPSPAGGDKTVMLEDVALMCGGKVFTEKKGDKVDEVKIEDLGRAERFIAHKDDSVIVGPRGDKEVVENAINDIEKSIVEAVDDREKKLRSQRLARFKNKVGVIKVGSPTESESVALKYKVEDAVNATQAAYKGGVVCGGGLSLARLKTSSELLNTALQVPFRQLKNNVGLHTHRELGPDEAINVVTDEIGQWMEVGVLDPVDVLKAQVESAISIASLLVTTSGIIVEPPKKLRQE